MRTGFVSCIPPFPSRQRLTLLYLDQRGANTVPFITQHPHKFAKLLVYVGQYYENARNPESFTQPDITMIYDMSAFGIDLEIQRLVNVGALPVDATTLADVGVDYHAPEGDWLDERPDIPAAALLDAVEWVGWQDQAPRANDIPRLRYRWLTVHVRNEAREAPTPPPPSSSSSESDH